MRIQVSSHAKACAEGALNRLLKAINEGKSMDEAKEIVKSHLAHSASLQTRSYDIEHLSNGVAIKQVVEDRFLVGCLHVSVFDAFA